MSNEQLIMNNGGKKPLPDGSGFPELTEVKRAE